MCNAGFYGTIATQQDSCTPCTVCPAGKTTTTSACTRSVDAQCGDIDCPANSTGTNLRIGDCTCDVGFFGTIVESSDQCSACTVCDANTKVIGTPCTDTTNTVCADIECPANSHGTNVAAGDCACNPGYSGTIATATDTCTACMDGSLRNHPRSGF